MGSPPYRQVALDHPDFAKQCIAVKNGTQRCRNKRSCDYAKNGQAGKKEVEKYTTKLLTQWFDMVPPQREAVAVSLAELVICGPCIKGDKAKEVAKTMLEQLARVHVANIPISKGRAETLPPPYTTPNAPIAGDPFAQPNIFPARVSLSSGPSGMHMPSAIPPREQSTINPFQTGRYPSRKATPSNGFTSGPNFQAFGPPLSTQRSVAQAEKADIEQLEKLRQLEEENTTLKARNEKLSQDNVKCLDKFDQLEKMNTDLKAENQRLGQENVKLEVDHRDKLARLEKEIASSKAENQKLGQDNDKLESKVRRRDDRIQGLNKELEEAKADEDLLEKEQERLRLANLEIKQLEEDVADARKWERMYRGLRSFLIARFAKARSVVRKFEDDLDEEVDDLSEEDD